MGQTPDAVVDSERKVTPELAPDGQLEFEPEEEVRDLKISPRGEPAPPLVARAGHDEAPVLDTLRVPRHAIDDPSGQVLPVEDGHEIGRLHWHLVQR